MRRSMTKWFSVDWSTLVDNLVLDDTITGQWYHLFEPGSISLQLLYATHDIEHHLMCLACLPLVLSDTAWK
jgi:hypothetical protein